MASKRAILELLTREELQNAAYVFDVAVEDRRVREQLIDALGPSRRASLEGILSGLSRDRLKEVCAALDLSDSGREKGVLIARILGLEQTERPERSQRIERSRSRRDASFGRKLYEARVAVGLSQAEVGERLDVSQATVSSWENDHAEPSAEQRRKLQRFLEFEPATVEETDADGATEEVSAFGVWLSRTRNEARLTIPELANKSGVSAGKYTTSRLVGSRILERRRA